MRVNRSFKEAAVAAVVASGALLVTVPVQAEPIVGLLGGAGGTGSALVTFDSATPGAAGAPVAVSGLTGDSRLVGIDLRPSTGVLYGVGNAGGLYTINRASGAATSVGSISVPLSGTSFGVDFNPVPDLVPGAASLRITSNTGQNMRVNVNAGLIGTATVDGPLNSASSSLFASAYVNNDVDPTTVTMLFGIGPASGGLGLYQQTNPNLGTLSFIGSLGIAGTGPSTDVGFDVSALAGATFAALASNGVFGLYAINLVTGAASLFGTIPLGAAYNAVVDIAALTAPVPEPETYALMLAGLAGLAAVARRRRPRGAS